MKFKGTLIGEASGSLASLTFSHNRGGQYIRQRAIPVNPGTGLQIAVRSFFSALQERWSSVLTQAQRDAWDLYAEQTPLLDALGEPRNVGGKGMYTRGNVARQQGSLSIVDDGPEVSGLPALTAPVPALDTTAGLSSAFTNTDAWANETGGALLIYMGQPRNASRNFYKGPFRFVTSVLGNPVPPTSPSAQLPGALPFPVTNGQRYTIRYTAVRADGRQSPEVLVDVIATTE